MDDRAPLTRRGWAVLAVAVGGTVVGILFGTPAINAIVVPAGVALAVAAWQVRDVATPRVERRSPAEGTVGERHRIEIRLVDPPDRLGRVADRVPAPLEAAGHDRPVALADGLTYDLELTTRGVHELGPTTVVVQDLFGLATRTFTVAGTTPVEVRPRVLPLHAGALERLAHLADVTLEPERHEFDRLREYRPTDALRDIHWKTSAKRPDVPFIVKEFVRIREGGSVVLSGEADPGCDGALADAMASVAVAMAEADVRVGLATAAGTVDPIDHPATVDRLLGHLARVGSGAPADRGEIHLRAETNEVSEVTIEVDRSRRTMGDLLAGTPRRATERPVPAPGVAD